MFKSVLIKMRRQVRAGRLTLPIHSREEMINDRLTTADIEDGILRGEIIERQWDEKRQEWKCVISGHAVDGRSIEIVAKLGKRDDTLIITVYRIF